MCTVSLFTLCVGGKETTIKQWLHRVSQQNSGPCDVLAFMKATWAKFMLILPTLQHHPLHALCRSIKKTYPFPCEGNVLSFNRVVSHLNEARHIEDVSRGSLSSYEILTNNKRSVYRRLAS
jgi:hypothetical protein